MHTPITIEATLRIHDFLIKEYGGLGGVRDDGILEAALSQPWQGFGETSFYPSIEEKSARLAFEVITQHPFNDGNKRTGAALIAALLQTNGISYNPDPKELFQAIISVADGSAGYEDLLEFVRKNTAR